MPGFGFDYTHFFAVHPNYARFQRGTGVVIPFIGGAFYLPVPLYTDEGAAAQQAEDTEAPDQSNPGEEPPLRDTIAPVRSQVQYEAPPKEQSEYVFVRRDGTLIFAVAYSWINDRLQYVTEEGLRRTVALNALDLDATTQFNEQRGVSMRPPA